jgi:calcineurin-like phosphoesterase family protein
MIYLSSDLHFNHENIIRYCSRPFKDANHMNECLIATFNSIIGPNDLLIHAGDFGMGGKDKHQSFRDRLLFPIWNVVGNHDYKSPVKFDKTFDRLKIKYKGKLILIQHVPHDGLEEEYDIFLHGHTHGEWQTKRDSKGRPFYDCGVDAWEMKPVKLDTILEMT